MSNSILGLAIGRTSRPLLDSQRLRQCTAGALRPNQRGSIHQQVPARAGAHVLVLGQGTGVLALLAARAGAARVSGVERSRMLFRMARQALAANVGAANAGRIRLLDCPLRCIGVAGAQQLPEQAPSCISYSLGT